MDYMGNRIAELRRLSGLTLQDLADRANCSREQVYRLERGKRGLTIEWMRRLAGALECKASDLLPADDFNPRLDASESFLLAQFRQLSEDNRARYLRVSEAVRTALAETEGTDRKPAGPVRLAS